MDETLQQVGASAPVTSHKETSDNYARVICSDDRWRVICCKDGLQWIIQRSKKRGTEKIWLGIGCVTTKRALIRLQHALGCEFGHALEALTETIGAGMDYE